MGKGKRIRFTGITSLIDPNDTANLQYNSRGQFMLINKKTADNAIKKGKVPLYFHHDKNMRIGTVNRFYRADVPYRPDKAAPEIMVSALMAEYEVTNQDFIEAIQEIAEEYNAKQSDVYSSDGFVEGLANSGRGRDVTAYEVFKHRMMGLSLGHNVSGNDDSIKPVEELSITVAGQRDGTIMESAVYEADTDIDEYEATNKVKKTNILSKMASFVHYNDSDKRNQKVAKDKRALLQTVYTMLYGCEDVDVSEEDIYKTALSRVLFPTRENVECKPATHSSEQSTTTEMEKKAPVEQPAQSSAFSERALDKFLGDQFRQMRDACGSRRPVKRRYYDEGDEDYYQPRRFSGGSSRRRYEDEDDFCSPPPMRPARRSRYEDGEEYQPHYDATHTIKRSRIPLIDESPFRHAYPAYQPMMNNHPYYQQMGYPHQQVMGPPSVIPQQPMNQYAPPSFYQQQALMQPMAPVQQHQQPSIAPIQQAPVQQQQPSMAPIQQAPPVQQQPPSMAPVQAPIQQAPPVQQQQVQVAPPRVPIQQAPVQQQLLAPAQQAPVQQAPQAPVQPEPVDDDKPQQAGYSMEVDVKRPVMAREIDILNACSDLF